jgi:hypothetical protein
MLPLNNVDVYWQLLLLHMEHDLFCLLGTQSSKYGRLANPLYVSDICTASALPDMCSFIDSTHLARRACTRYSTAIRVKRFAEEKIDKQATIDYSSM